MNQLLVLKKVVRMKNIGLALALSVALFLGGGCKKQPSDNDAIRVGILQHLNGVGTLNMSAMDMDMRSVSINGNQAHAEVVFRPKNGAPAGAGMQVAYNLEKRDGVWVVQRSQTTGGMIEHPNPNKNPHQNPDVPSGSLPKFSDIVNPAGTPTQGALPPGHPPINTQPSGQDQTPVKKPA